MRLVLNASVYSHGVAVKRETCYAMDVADGLHKLVTNRDVEITSIVDGQHSAIHSAHYQGLAFDMRIWYLPDVMDYVGLLQQKLGSDYQVIFETNHIHVEFQPTRG